MPLLNYTTEVPASKSLGEIQSMLVAAKAESILTEFRDGRVLSVCFKIKSPYGILAIRLPADVDAVYRVLAAERKRYINASAENSLRQQAERVAWRIQKDWLEAQLAIVKVKMAELQQVFLPYIQDPETGQTVYEKLHEQKFSGLCLPAPKSA